MKTEDTVIKVLKIHFMHIHLPLSWYLSRNSVRKWRPKMLQINVSINCTEVALFEMNQSCELFIKSTIL